MRLADLVSRYLARTEAPLPRAGGPCPDPTREISIDQAQRFTHREAVYDLPPFISGWPAEWLEVFTERSAIMEFDGCLDQLTAESRAVYWTRILHRFERDGRWNPDRDDDGEARA